MGYWPSVRSRWLDIDQVLFCVFMDRMRTLSSHLDGTSLVNKDLLYGFRRNFSWRRTRRLVPRGQDIYLINQAWGPYWENIGPRSWQYGPSTARSVQKRPRADILPVRSRASLVNKRFITRLKKTKTAKTQVQDHSGQCPVRYLENIGPAIEHFDWLILVIGPLTAWVV